MMGGFGVGFLREFCFLVSFGWELHIHQICVKQFEAHPH